MKTVIPAILIAGLLASAAFADSNAPTRTLDAHIADCAFGPWANYAEWLHCKILAHHGVPRPVGGL